MYLYIYTHIMYIYIYSNLHIQNFGNNHDYRYHNCYCCKHQKVHPSRRLHPAAGVPARRQRRVVRHPICGNALGVALRGPGGKCREHVSIIINHHPSLLNHIYEHHMDHIDPNTHQQLIYPSIMVVFHLLSEQWPQNPFLIPLNTGWLSTGFPVLG